MNPGSRPSASRATGPRVCLAANTLYYPAGGGHLWVYLNWALGLTALGCRVIWLETADPARLDADNLDHVAALKRRLQPYGLADALALCSASGEQPLAPGATLGCLPFEAACDADLLLNLAYEVPEPVVRRFRRSAMIDIDPGLLQVWMRAGTMRPPAHDVYFTTGETVGQPGTRIPDVGLTWHYTPPCVAVDWWPIATAASDAPFSTVSHWYGRDEWVDDEDGGYCNDKREGFLPYLELPRLTAQPLELALCLGGDDDDERRTLVSRNWRVRDSGDVTSTPWDYQRYIQGSRGEFSCVKPSCTRLQNAWISDRTLCYLASGKPAVVEHTGPSEFLPDAAGLFRFRDLREAADCLEAVAADYERQSGLARALAVEHFDAKTVAGRVLERALASLSL